MPFVTLKSTIFNSLFLSDGQYVGSPLNRWFKLLLFIVLSSSRLLGVMSLDSQILRPLASHKASCRNLANI
jgi:hypothetical protein